MGRIIGHTRRFGLRSVQGFNKADVEANLACGAEDFSKNAASPSTGATTLVHITDAHVAPHGRQTAALKHRSVEVFRDLVAQIAEMDVDSTLFGGDNIDNRGHGESDLEVFLDEVGPLEDRWLAQFGNHEAASSRSGRLGKYAFAAAVGGRGVGPHQHDFSRSVGSVRVIGLDTTLIGSPSGFVSPDSLRFLVKEIQAAPEPHIVVLGHHPIARSWAPYAQESWDREYLVANRESVVSVLSHDPRVRAYLCGHHHSSRIQAVGGFLHVQTASPISFPHTSRVLRFFEDRLEIVPLLPRLEGLLDEGAKWVLTGRKHERFQKLDMKCGFLEYLSGTLHDQIRIFSLTERGSPNRQPLRVVPLR